MTGPFCGPPLQQGGPQKGPVMASSSSSSSSANYENVVRGGLKLKGSKATQNEVGATNTKKRKKSQQQEEIEMLKDAARQKEEEEADLAKCAKAGKTAAERAYEI